MKIIVVCNLSLKKLPPAISLINCLNEMEHEVVLITPYLDTLYKKMFQNLKSYEFYRDENWEELLVKKNFISKYKILFHKYNDFIIKHLEYEYQKGDIIWLLHENTALRLDDRILKYPYILSVYELTKEIKVLRYFPSKVKKVAKYAKVVVTPEYNRANILAVWWNLKRVPLVFPNKPFIRDSDMMEDNDIKKTKEHLKKTANGRKIVLYQGVFGPDRKLDIMIDAIKDNTEYLMVLMGPKNEYLAYLIDRYKDNVLYIPSISAPKHLLITQMAYIGIVNYVTNNSGQYDPLNVIYCAPNKIYEYGKYGIPMLCSNQPGLFYTVGMKNAGLCIDTEKIDNIKSAISEISNHYEKYKTGAEVLYNAVHNKEIIKEIIADIRERTIHE